MATGAEKGAKTRKWRKEFDPAPYLAAIGATPVPEVYGMGKLANGRTVNVTPGAPGKVCVMLGDPFATRNFGKGDVAAMKEWVARGGSLAKEEARKALVKAAPLLRDLLAEHLAWYDGKGVDEAKLIADTRAALKSTEGV